MPDTKVITGFQTDVRKVKLMDRIAEDRGISRSELIRRAIDEKLDRDFYGIVEDDDDPSRDPAA